MSKRKTIEIVVFGVIVIGIISLVLVVNSKKISKENVITLGNIKYEVKQDIKKDNIKKEGSVATKEYKVEDLEKKDGKLIVQTKTEINNSDDAYKTAVFLKQSIERLNNEKINSDGIKQVDVVIKGSKNNWLYDGSNSIKKIDIK